MDAKEQIKQDVREGRVDVDRLVDLVVKSQNDLRQTKDLLDKVTGQLGKANQRIEELEKQLGGAGTKKLDEPYSVKEEEKRQAARGKRKAGRKPPKPKRRGRITTADKIALAQRTEQVYPADVKVSDCQLSHTRPVWRLENGQAVLVAYEIYRGPKNQYGKIPGVLGRGEYGLEFIVAIAFQVYVVGLSLDKVCLLMNFFQNLQLRKSQVDALMNQLSRAWESEFDALCTLLANSAIVHADETSWSLNSVWAFLSEKVRLYFFGVHKDAATLAKILDPATFAGLVISDDAAVYANFTNSQKCWAHLLRKAIKLTLLEPDNAEYRDFTDKLLEIYRTACRVQADRRFKDDGRKQRAAELDDEILTLCIGVWVEEAMPSKGPANDFRLLCNELMRLMLAEQLFTFATAAPVQQPSGELIPASGTNNEAERGLRDAATARRTGRTNKTLLGARRQTIVVSVLESLRRQLPKFTLKTVTDEIRSWSDAGVSRFTKLMRQMNLPPPTSILDDVLPIPPKKPQIA